MKTKDILHKIKFSLFAMQKYKNWREIIESSVKKQNPTKLFLRNGVRIEVPNDSAILPLVSAVFFENIYNPENFPIEPNDIVVDVGAHIGVFTLFAARRTEKTVYAYEPFSANFEFLNRNIHLNDLSNVIANNVAVSDKIGSAKLFIAEISGGHLLFDHSIDGKLKNYVEVPTITLKRIIDSNNLEQIDFLKLDCEGSEGSILTSTPKDYLKRVRKIAIEFHDNVSQLKHDDIKRLLEEVGFVTKLKWDSKSPFGYLWGRRD